MENAWKAAARHWWERMRQAERELEQEREMRAVLREHLDEETERASARQRELRDALSRLQSKSDDCEGELRARLTWTESRLESKQDEANELLQKLEELRGSLARETAVRLAHESAAVVKGVYAQPSGIPGELAALAARIAKADAKHPRDLPDTSHEINAERAVSRLRLARARVELEAFPAWDNAFECEVAEASAEIALGNPERLADELLDVAAVAMRWRRAVLERGKR